MRVNNILMAPIGRTMGIEPSFGAREFYDWAKDSDFLTTEDGVDEFVSSKKDSSSEELLGEDIQRIFEERDAKEGSSPVIYTLKAQNKNNLGGSFVIKTASLAAAMFLAGTVLLSGAPVIGEAMANSRKQAELEDRFKENPESVAHELISSMEFDKAAVDSFFNPFSMRTFSSMISGSIDEELIGDMPVGPDSRLGYKINDIVTTPDTTYQASLDIDGDDNPEIFLWADGGGYVDIFYDYNSDGKIDEHAIYDALGEAVNGMEKDAPKSEDITTISTESK